jgi:hypothetical protein
LQSTGFFVECGEEDGETFALCGDEREAIGAVD